MPTRPASAARPARNAGGRPRDPRLDGAILTAVRELLAEEGYSRLSFETVARRAGVTRPTIYRRWPSKAHLVHEAVFPADPGERVLIADTGDFPADVRRVIGDTIASYSRPEARAALAGLLADLHGNPELRAAVVDGLENRARGQFHALVARARTRGDVRPDADADALFDAVVGAVFTRVVSHGGVPEGYADTLTGTVLLGALDRGPGGT